MEHKSILENRETWYKRDKIERNVKRENKTRTRKSKNN
jgi:hypothetical protein